MADNSSEEELIMKMRKQYTITKQRERWTEEEHNKFLEALKLYGRAWQKIKEHIGTKMAVQIRSHAQKFFSKLEKEAVMKGVPLGQAYDIKVPPPRPKRKPCTSYPRKSSVGSLCPSGQAIDEKSTKSSSSLCTTKQVFDMESNEPQERREKEDSEDGTCSKVINLFHDVPSASISSANNASLDPRIHRGFVPVDKEMKDIAADTDTGGLQGMNSQTKPAQIVTEDPSMNPLASTTPEVPTYSEMSSIHQSFPIFPPFALFDVNQDVHRSFHNISSSLSNLIMTTLLQNPAVHAAARLAARFWSSANMAAPVSEIQESQCKPSPSLETVAAATVAAASAWWATQGLLPLFPPLQPAFAFAPVPTTAIPIMDIAEAPKDHQIENPDQSDAPAPPSSKSLISSTSSLESNKSKRCDVSHEPKASKIDEFKPAPDTGCDNSDQARSNKPNRSSCGSNTASSSEAKCEAKQIHSNYPPAGESSNRRFRSSGSINESWKEVSEEGRIAFRALFNRGVLPQSFSPPQTGDVMVNVSKDKQTTALQVDISKMRSDTDAGQLKARRTGFRPYKRCSVEAKESRATASEEGGIKRMRLEAKAST